MKFTEATVKSFRSDFENAVAELEAKYGVKVNLGVIRYDNNALRTQVTVEKTDEEAQLKIWTRERNYIALKDRRAANIEYGKEYVGNDGFKYTVTGFNSRKPKYCLEISRNGKTYNAPLGFLRLC